MFPTDGPSSRSVVCIGFASVVQMPLPAVECDAHLRDDFGNFQANVQVSCKKRATSTQAGFPAQTLLQHGNVNLHMQDNCLHDMVSFLFGRCQHSQGQLVDTQNELADGIRLYLFIVDQRC